MEWKAFLRRWMFNALAFRSGSTDIIQEPDQMPVHSTIPPKRARRIWTILIFFVLFMGVVYISCYPYTSSFETTFTVTTKIVKQLKGDNHQTYLIGTDKGSFKIEDTVLHWQFKSFDLFSQLQEGKTYRGKAYGFRSGFLSSFPNLYYIEEISK